MDLGLSADQEDIQALLRRLVTRHTPRTVVRAAEPLGYDPAVWGHLRATGVPGMGTPEALGGGGADLSVLTAAVDTLGAGLVPAPVVEHLVATDVLARRAPGDPRTADVVQGARIGAWAPRPADGVARLVPGGAVAEVVVALDGSELVALWGPPPAPGEVPVTLASAPVADRDLRRGDRVVLAEGPEARAEAERAGARWRVLTASLLAGLSAGALDLAVAYVKERVQFGVPIGSFQAVQHGLADLPGEIDGARLLTGEAAWALEAGARSASGASGTDLAVMAFHFAGEVARRTTAACVQYHGGYGYAEEQDAQLFYRRARGWSLVAGPPAEELRHLGRSLLEPAAAGA